MEIRRKIAGGLLVFFLTCGFLGAGVELQLNYSAWTLEPFSPLVEKKSEQMIEEGVRYSLGYFQYLYDAGGSETDFSGSRGNYIGLTAWYNLDARWSLGVKGEYLELDLPFTFHSRQQVSIPFIGSTDIVAQGGGKVEIRSVMISFLARWLAVRMGKFKLSTYGGLSLLPFKGTFFMEGSAQISLTYETYEEQLLVPEQTLQEVRELYGVPPKLIISPTLGISMQYNLFKQGGIIVDLSFSQGTLFAGGIFFLL